RCETGRFGRNPLAERSRRSPPGCQGQPDPEHRGRSERWRYPRGDSMRLAHSVIPGFIAALTLLGAASARPQEGPMQRHERVIEFMKKTAADLSARCLADITSLDAWQRRRADARRELL